MKRIRRAFKRMALWLKRIRESHSHRFVMKCGAAGRAGIDKGCGRPIDFLFGRSEKRRCSCGLYNSVVFDGSPLMTGRDFKPEGKQ